MIAEGLHVLLTKADALTWTNYCEIIAIFLLAIFCLLSIMKTRAASMAKGFLVLLCLIVVAVFLKLPIFIYVLERFAYLFLFVAAVIFAPELRHSLEKIGNLEFLGRRKTISSDKAGNMINAIGDAVGNLSRRKVGALICFEEKTDLLEFIETGIALDALCSSGLLINIFEKNTPLHDGAVIIRKDRVVAATCYLPLTEQYLSKTYGTRHRAALGLSEVSDALIIVVSEETGNIAVAKDGQLRQFLTPQDVMGLLVEHLYGKKNVPEINSLIGSCYEK